MPQGGNQSAGYQPAVTGETACPTTKSLASESAGFQPAYQ
jgi:hypothetical protein